ncbi:hypothetical protein [Mucilaginibacter sp.]
MPPEVIQIPYSKKSGYAGLAVLLILMLFLLKTAVTNYLVHDILGAGIFGIFVLFILFLMGLLITTRLIPALKGEVALELDENGVKDYIRNLILDWKDIEDIGLRPGRSTAMLVFELKFDSDFGKQVFVSLRWVDGKDQDIFKTVLNYFDAAEGIERVDEDEDEE